MREIVLDTETTGLSPADGDRVVEIGCIELINHVATDEHFHVYINPECPMPSAAEAVHGLGDEFLADKPVFAEVADGFLDFVGEAPLVIHNASFDMGFLNAEFRRLGRPPLADARAIDTVSMARRKHPGAPASLDALCRRFGIDNSARSLHGALLDAELLAEVYLELIGGRQPGLELASVAPAAREAKAADRVARAPRPHAASAEERAAHEKFLEKITDPLWRG
ncbi:MAG: DNA polymerase III subunit epsilon [Alphaproteobacteria bacterium]